MNLTIKVASPLVQLDHQYQTRFGKATRQELFERYAPTAQYCLTWGARNYTMYSGAELIMRAVIAMIDPSSIRNSQEYIVQKLTIGLNSIGYDLVSHDGAEKPPSILPRLYMGSKTRFPNYGKHYQDYQTGEVIGHIGLLRYLDLLDAALEQTENYQCDWATRCLVKAVRILTEPDPDKHLAKLEPLLWEAAKRLGYRLNMVRWYQEMALAPNN